MNTQQTAPGSLSVIGLGPGDARLLAPEAAAALAEASVIAGYSGYVRLLDASQLAGRRVLATGMMGEVARASAAVDAALAGESVALVCSGDPGVYAMAGLALELMEERGLTATAPLLRVIPGIPAVCAAAALLGAPLMHDFACVSLSDLLTPRQTIVRRLECALAGDFVLVLYNPRSKKRTSLLEEALALALRHRTASTPVGIVRNAFRPEQEVSIAPLDRVDPERVDMFTLLIMGNSFSRIVPGRGDAPLAWENGARMLTPRGYRDKYTLAAPEPAPEPGP